MNAVDNSISGLLAQCIYLGGMIFITAATVVVMAGWQMLLPALAIIVLGLTLGHVYMTAQLPVKRLKSNAKAPILAHVQSTLIGLGAYM